MDFYFEEIPSEKKSIIQTKPIVSIMRFRHLFCLITFLTISFAQFGNAQQRSCNSADYLERQKLEDPLRIKNLEEIERLTQEFIKNNGDGNAEATVYTIPVVFSYRL